MSEKSSPAFSLGQNNDVDQFVRFFSIKEGIPTISTYPWEKLTVNLKLFSYQMMLKIVCFCFCNESEFMYFQLENETIKKWISCYTLYLAWNLYNENDRCMHNASALFLWNTFDVRAQPPFNPSDKFDIFWRRLKGATGRRSPLFCPDWSAIHFILCTH